MDIRTFQKGDIIFHQGDSGDCMYSILSGSVGIIKNYREEHETVIAVLGEGDFVGEMELIESAKRSATAVALSDKVQLNRLTDNNYLDFFESNPLQVYLIMKQLSERLRVTTQDYTDACRTIYETMKVLESGETPSSQLLEDQKRFHSAYQKMTDGITL